MKERVMNDTDRNLLQRFAQRRDADAFAGIVERYQDLVYCTCLRILGNAADAQDATQDCFLRLLRKAGTVESSLAGWLHRCATVVAIDELRSRAARRTREEVGCQMKANIDPSWHDLAPHLDQALDQLPDDLRAIVVEHFLQRRTQAEIASELGVSPTTIARRLDTAMEALRANLKKAGVIASAGVLAALISENAAQAAPAAVAAALSKMSILAAAESGAPAAPAAVGVAGAAKGKLILAAAMVSIIAAIGVYVLATGTWPATRPGPQPPVQQQAAAQPAVAPVAATAKPEPPKAPPVDPLLLALPEDAPVLVYVPNGWRMLENAAKLVPSMQELVDLKTSLTMAQWGLNAEMVDVESSVAMLITPGDRAGFAEKIELLRPRSINAITASMDGGPDADGIYTRAEPPGGSGVFGMNMLPWRGYAAFSEQKSSLLWLAKAGGKTWTPSPEAIKMVEGNDAFAHANASARLLMNDDSLAKAVGPRAAALMKTLAGQTNHIDVAIRYGEEGARISGILSAKAGGMIAQYLTPAPGLDALEPKLPALPNAAIGAWARSDKPTMDRLLALLADGNDMLMSYQIGGPPVNPEGVMIISPALRSLLPIHQEIGGMGFGVVYQPAPQVTQMEGVGAIELRKPEEFKARFLQRVDALNKKTRDAQGDKAPRYEYVPDAESVGIGREAVGIDCLRVTKDISGHLGIAGMDLNLSAYISVTVSLGIAGNYLLVASSASIVQQCAQTLAGRDGIATFPDQEAYKAALDRIGTGHNVVVLIDVVPFARPEQLPLQGPIAIGLKARKGNVLAIEAFVSRQAIDLRSVQQAPAGGQ